MRRTQRSPLVQVFQPRQAAVVALFVTGILGRLAVLVTACMLHGFGGCMPGWVDERTPIMFGSCLYQAELSVYLVPNQTAASPSQLLK